MKITFNNSFKDSILNQTKIVTRRPVRCDYCDYGYENYIVELCIVDNKKETRLCKAKIISIKQENLHDSIHINDELKKEGVKSVDEFINLWDSFYDEYKYETNPKVWVISFDINL